MNLYWDYSTFIVEMLNHTDILKQAATVLCHYGGNDGTDKTTNDFENLACSCKDVDEGDDSSFIFIHKLPPEVNRYPYGLKLARLTNMFSVMMVFQYLHADSSSRLA